MPLGNYRDVDITLNGEKMSIGGFQRPGDDVAVFEELKSAHQVGAVVSLSGDYSGALKAAGMDPTFYTCGTSVEVYDWFNTPFEQTERIKPEVYDAVYAAVERAQEGGKKIAIHCGAGDGRTGTALASLKLRELLEKEYAENNMDFDIPQEKTETAHAHFGAPKTGKACDVKVTPLVKQAIEEVRKFDNEGHTSVESPNDMATLVLYERHLRQQFALRDESVLDSSWVRVGLRDIVSASPSPGMSADDHKSAISAAVTSLNQLGKELHADDAFFQNNDDLGSKLDSLIEKANQLKGTDPAKAQVLEVIIRRCRDKLSLINDTATIVAQPYKKLHSISTALAELQQELVTETEQEVLKKHNNPISALFLTKTDSMTKVMEARQALKALKESAETIEHSITPGFKFKS